MAKGMTTSVQFGAEPIDPMVNMRLGELRKLAKAKKIKVGDKTKDQLIAELKK